MSSCEAEVKASASPAHDAMPSPSPDPTVDIDSKGKGKDNPDLSSSSSPSVADTQSPVTDTRSPSPSLDTEDGATDNVDTVVTPPGTFSAGAWQAIYSPQHGAYYFYNSESGETTWVNPLESSSSSSFSSSADPSSSSSQPKSNAEEMTTTTTTAIQSGRYDPTSVEARALAAGIDPSLAHLDPSLSLPTTRAPAGTFTAHFNARTGAFTAVDARTPQHLSEFERMKRMSEFYFDVHAWEKEVEERDKEEKEGGKKRKRPSKKDLDRFKEQKRLKKIAKTAWLRT